MRLIKVAAFEETGHEVARLLIYAHNEAPNAVEVDDDVGEERNSVEINTVAETDFGSQ